MTLFYVLYVLIVVSVVLILMLGLSNTPLSANSILHVEYDNFKTINYCQ